MLPNERTFISCRLVVFRLTCRTGAERNCEKKTPRSSSVNDAMPRHQNSFACGMDAPELTVEKRVRRAGRPNANGGNKVQKHPGKVSINPSVRMHDPGAFKEDEDWSDEAGCASEETTASETPETQQAPAAKAELEHWDVVSQGKTKEDEWPSLKKSCDPDLQDYDLFETMSQVSDMTLGSWVDVEDCDSPSRALTLAEQRAAAGTWASRIGPSNGLPKPKTALPWAGKLRPTPEEKACQSPDDDLEPQDWGPIGEIEVLRGTTILEQVAKIEPQPEGCRTSPRRDGASPAATRNERGRLRMR
eukprot:s93_g19.t1